MRIWDFALALAVFVYNAPIQGVGGASPWYEFGIPLGLCAPWVVRRRWPLTVMGIMLAAAVVQSLLAMDVLVADFMLAAGVYNVALRYRWPFSSLAAGLTIAWGIVAFGSRLDELYLSIGDFGSIVLLVITAWTGGALIRVRRLHVESLEERARQLEREKETQQKVIAAAERSRIARELHDIVSHSLSSVVLLADGASLKVHDEPDRAQHAMELVRDSARGALGEMRRILDLLRDEQSATETSGSGARAPRPGVADLDTLVAESRAAGLPVQLTVGGDPVGLSEGLDLAVYRIVQESLTNARKHAGPELTAVTVRIDYPTSSGVAGDDLVVRIVDDGSGASTARPAGGGHGLVGMRERVGTFAGTLSAGTLSAGTPPAGTLSAGTGRGGGYQVVAHFPASELGDSPEAGPQPAEELGGQG